MSSSRYRAVLEKIDRVHREDPRTERADGVDHPQELLYAERMSAWLAKLGPSASETLRLAVRCQHIRRWAIPRSDFPAGGDGYRAWRTALSRFHAEEAGVILRETGYDTDTVERVQTLIRKEKLRTDPETQMLEDVACLVFLEFYAARFAEKQEEQKTLDILAKTWLKMSPRARDMALEGPLPPDVRSLIDRIVKTS
ncbi:MAG: DUF4202 domain-containing protein [candidate division Zixibacteria bacterium]|nr:DUF4202 domain-containing protein [candidate division Zixibacteria bacterium]